MMKRIRKFENGGYTEESKNQRKNMLRLWDPTGGYNAFNYVTSFLLKNGANGEENEYYKEYLGFPSKVPKMNSNAYTEWDKQIEEEKKKNNQPASEFYGTTPRMDWGIQALADTLNLGKIVRNYDKYKDKKLPSKERVMEIYKKSKELLDNPNKWIQMNGNKTMYNKTNPELNESNPIGMLQYFGLKWNPKDQTLHMHDTYDFSDLARFVTRIPQRPREMKIRSKIKFNPKQGSMLLRNDLENYNNLPKSVTQ